MNEKKFQNRLNKLFEKAINKKRKCCFPGCDIDAINSHILQKNGILKGISNNGHLIVSKTDFLKNELFYFKKSGIQITYTFKGFCQEHDSKVFKPIENDEIDFDNYNNQLLFAYRTILNEKRKKEVLIDWNNYQINDTELSRYLDIEIARGLNVQNKLAIKDLEYYEKIIINDLNSNNENFNFRIRSTKMLDICLASHFTYETTRQRQEKINKTGDDYDILTDIFISYFPLEDENVLIMGYLKSMEDICGKYVNEFFEVNEDILLKKISSLLLTRCEEWACSELFYNEYIKSREKTIIEIFHKAVKSIDEDKEIDFNLFDN